MGCGRNSGNGTKVKIGEDFTEKISDVELEMVYVKGGTFSMGNTFESGTLGYAREKPVHQVTLSDYYIGKYEVTQGQWKRVMRGKRGGYFQKGDDYPVESVTWHDAQAFCKKLSRLTGKKYVLPTEAQWEYAARGGCKNENTKYSGSEVIDEVAWYISNSDHSTHPVGMKSPNALGIYDMSGNVSEWCQDWDSFYQKDPQTDPQGPVSGSGRVFRGGNWKYWARNCRVSTRNYGTPTTWNEYSGFRVVLLP